MAELLRLLLEFFGLSLYEDGSADVLGCILPDWGCKD